MHTNYRVIIIVEQSTFYKFLLHITMKYTSKDYIPQQLKQKLIKKKLSYISKTCDFNILTVVHDGKK